MTQLGLYGLFTLVWSLAMQTQAIAGSVDFGSHHNPVVVSQSPLDQDFSVLDFNTDPASASAPSEVRVRIFPHNNEKYNAPAGADTVWDQVTFRTTGTCSTYRASGQTSKEGNHDSTAITTAKVIRFSASMLTHPLWVKCTTPPEVVRVGFEKKSIRYKGKFFLKQVRPRNRGPYLTVINVVSETDYLKGVVPSEMPASWPAEALRVQAVAARTYFRYEIASKVADKDPNLVIEDAGAQLDDSVLYQAYLGVYGSAATDAAVEETANEVMTYNGQIIKAYFSADSGGHTENAENVWGVALPYALGKPEPYPDGSVSISRWNVNKSFRDIQERLLALGLITKSAPLNGLSITGFYTHGRASEVTALFSDGTSQPIGGLDFAHACGLRSNWFEFSAAPSGVQIKGRGFGHGVGMNQWGSRVLVGDAFKRTYKQILEYYYTGIKLERL